MYRIIMLSVLAITLSSCSSINNYFTEYADFRDAFPEYTKSSFMSEYALSEDEYNEWREIMISEAHDLFTSNGAQPPAWQNGNQLYLKNNSRRIITMPQSEIEHIQLAQTLNDDPKVEMLLLGDDGIYTIAYYSDKVVRENSYGGVSYEYNNDGSYKYETIFKCYHFKFESLLKANSELLGKTGWVLAQKSRQYLKPKKERKEQEEERLAKEADRLEKEKIEKALSDKRKATEEKALKLISEIKNRKINTLQIRELYLGMPAEECALLLNYYLGLPTDESSGFYTYDEESGLIVNGGIFNTTYYAQQSADKKVKGIYFTRTMTDKILNASSLEPRELAQAIVDKFNMVPSMEYGEVGQTLSLSGNSVYGWKYTDTKNGFRISISENNTLLLQSVAKNSELTL